jgi:hypothetical protein
MSMTSPFKYGSTGYHVTIAKINLMSAASTARRDALPAKLIRRIELLTNAIDATRTQLEHLTEQRNAAKVEHSQTLPREMLMRKTRVVPLVERRRSEPTRNGHVLYQDGDEDVPDILLDRRGNVTLDQCKLCGRAEIELSEPCEINQPTEE